MKNIESSNANSEEFLPFALGLTYWAYTHYVFKKIKAITTILYSYYIIY